MTRKLTNPLFLFLAVWTSAGMAYLLGIVTGLFPDVERATAGIVLLGILTFCLGYLTWTLFLNVRPPADKPIEAPPHMLSTERVARGLKFTFLMGLIVLALGFYRISMVASYFGDSFLDLLTHPVRLRQQLVLFISTSIFEVNHITMLISVTSSLFSIGFVLLGVFLALSRSIVRYVYLCGFLLVSLGIGLSNLSRFEVTVHILYIILAYCFACHWRDPSERRNPLVGILIPFIAAAALFIVIEFLLDKGGNYAQPGRLRGFLFSFYWYLASPLAAFNEYIANFEGHYRLGQNMFFPFYKWLCRFGLAPETNLSVYGDMINIPYAANVYTYLRNIYDDFGVLGIAVAPYTLGWLTAAVRAKAAHHFHYLNLYLILLVLIIFSFYNYYLFSNQIYLQIFFGFLFFRWSVAPQPNAQSAGSLGAHVLSVPG